MMKRLILAILLTGCPSGTRLHFRLSDAPAIVRDCGIYAKDIAIDVKYALAQPDWQRRVHVMSISIPDGAKLIACILRSISDNQPSLNDKRAVLSPDMVKARAQLYLWAVENQTQGG